MFFTNDLPFLPDRMKLHEVEKIVANLHDKKECYTHRNFKTRIKL